MTTRASGKELRAWKQTLPENPRFLDNFSQKTRLKHFSLIFPGAHTNDGEMLRVITSHTLEEILQVIRVEVIYR